MSITDQDKQLVVNSFSKIATIADQTTELFYNRLFEIAPEVKPLFAQTDMREQGRKIMQTLGTAVGALYQLETIGAEIHDLGKRHIAYGVTDDQYRLVGEALIWAIAESLGDEFTDEVRAAWDKIYTLLSEMARGAYEKV